MIELIGQTIEEWAKRYGLSLEPRKCGNCEKLLFPELPFATQEWRGLRSKPHDCGSNYDLIRMKSATDDFKNLYKDLKDGLTAEDNNATAFSIEDET